MKRHLFPATQSVLLGMVHNIQCYANSRCILLVRGEGRNRVLIIYLIRYTCLNSTVYSKLTKFCICILMSVSCFLKDLLSKNLITKLIDCSSGNNDVVGFLIITS